MDFVLAMIMHYNEGKIGCNPTCDISLRRVLFDVFIDDLKIILCSCYFVIFCNSFLFFDCWSIDHNIAFALCKTWTFQNFSCDVHKFLFLTYHLNIA